MQARKPALQSLTVLEAAFVLETEFIQLTESSYGPVARLKHLHWLRTGRVKACPLTFKEMISDHFFACTTKMSELDRCKPVPFSSTQSRANKPGIRRPTSSRRFDYLIVKEQFQQVIATRSRTGCRWIASAIKEELVQSSGCNFQSPRFRHRGQLPPGVGEPTRS